MGKSSISMTIFNSELLNYRRVNDDKWTLCKLNAMAHWIWWFAKHGFVCLRWGVQEAFPIDNTPAIISYLTGLNHYPEKAVRGYSLERSTYGSDWFSTATQSWPYLGCQWLAENATFSNAAGICVYIYILYTYIHIYIYLFVYLLIY